MRKTKIICTIGPASSDEATLSQMLKAGMNVARLNFSHGTHEEQQQRVDMLKALRQKEGRPLAIMLDTKGPEYRIGKFATGKVELKEGATFTFTTDEVVGDETQVSVSYKNLAHELFVGDKILVNNGLLEFVVEQICGERLVCKVLSGGVMSDKKSMSFPGRVLKQPFLSDQDKADLLFAVKNDVEFIACSFVSCKEDMQAVVDFLETNGAKNITLIAKIENRAGIDNIDEICELCGGVMIGRGDMGVEIAFEELPSIQKQIVKRCRLLGKRVIIATEMLESMIKSPRPTRAESSDVANAVYEGASAIMLSGETAAGAHPVLVVQTMAKIALAVERSLKERGQFLDAESAKFKIKNETDAISHSVCSMALDIGAKAIVVCSLSGMTSRMVSRFRPLVDIIGFTVEPKIFHQLSLSWGVTPVLASEVFPSLEVLFYNAKQVAIKNLNLVKNDKIIVTGSTSKSLGINTVKIETVG